MCDFYKLNYGGDESKTQNFLSISSDCPKTIKNAFCACHLKNKWLILATKNSKGSFAPLRMTIFGQSGPENLGRTLLVFLRRGRDSKQTF